MKTLHLNNVKIRAIGRVTPPKDLREAARKSLSPDGFDKLMQRIGHRDPTAAEICAAMEQTHDDRTCSDTPQQSA